MSAFVTRGGHFEHATHTKLSGDVTFWPYAIEQYHITSTAYQLRATEVISGLGSQEKH